MCGVWLHEAPKKVSHSRAPFHVKLDRNPLFVISSVSDWPSLKCSNERGSVRGHQGRKIGSSERGAAAGCDNRSAEQALLQKESAYNVRTPKRILSAQRFNFHFDLSAARSSLRKPSSSGLAPAFCSTISTYLDHNNTARRHQRPYQQQRWRQPTLTITASCLTRTHQTTSP